MAQIEPDERAAKITIDDITFNKDWPNFFKSIEIINDDIDDITANKRYWVQSYPNYYKKQRDSDFYDFYRETKGKITVAKENPLYKLAIRVIPEILSIKILNTEEIKEQLQFTLNDRMFDDVPIHIKQELIEVEDLEYILHWMTNSGFLSRQEVENGDSVTYSWRINPNKRRPKKPIDWHKWNVPPESPGKVDPPYKEKPTKSEHEFNELAIAQSLQGLRTEIAELTKKNQELEKKVERLDKARLVKMVIETNGKPIKVRETVHEAFPEVIFQIKCGYPVMLVGPSGCGKTELAMGVARHLKREFGMLSLSGGVTESKIFGRVTPNVQTGKSEYNQSQFVKFAEEGGIFLLDECDAADPNVVLSLNSLLSNKTFTVDRKVRPVIKLHPKFVCMAAVNTWGHGADRQYVGRNQQDSAFLKRFVMVDMDYDKNLEYKLCPSKEGAEFVERMHHYRERIRVNRIERVIDTRFIVRGYNWMRHGKDIEYIDSHLFKGWRDDEVRKVKG